MNSDDVIQNDKHSEVAESLRGSFVSVATSEETLLSLSSVLKTELPALTYETDVPNSQTVEREVNPYDASLLKTAAESGDLKTFKLLLEKLGGVNKTTDRLLQTALLLASSYGQCDILCELIKIGIRIDSCVSTDGATCLHAACRGGHVTVLDQLLEYVGDVDAVDVRGQTAVHVAALNGELECITALNIRGALLDITDKAGNQPIHLAVSRNHKPIVDFLYDCGIDLVVGDRLSRQPVHIAARHGALECLVSLVEKNCDVITPDAAGSRPIHHAAVKNHVDCVRFLVAQGTGLEVCQSEGKTPLYIAAENGSLKVVHWLLENGSKVNIQDKCGKTACHAAASRSHAEAVNCLLCHGANLNLIDSLNMTALDLARKHGHPIHIGKAVNGQVQCPYCSKKQAFASWNAAHPVPSSVRQVSATRCYSTPASAAAKKTTVAGGQQSMKPIRTNQARRQDIHKSPSDQSNRSTSSSLAVKFYGLYLQ